MLDHTAAIANDNQTAQTKRHYVYIHRRADDGRIFYVGKGTRDRATSKRSRSRHWHNVVRKHGFTAEITAHYTTSAEAYAAETALIAEYEAAGVALVNKHPGGGGGSSRVSKALWEDDEYRERTVANVSAASRKNAQDPAWRARVAAAGRDFNTDDAPLVGICVRHSKSGPRYRAHIRHNGHRIWASSRPTLAEARADRVALEHKYGWHGQ